MAQAIVRLSDYGSANDQATLATGLFWLLLRDWIARDRSDPDPLLPWFAQLESEYRIELTPDIDPFDPLQDDTSFASSRMIAAQHLAALVAVGTRLQHGFNEDYSDAVRR